MYMIIEIEGFGFCFSENQLPTETTMYKIIPLHRFYCSCDQVMTIIIAATY